MTVNDPFRSATESDCNSSDNSDQEPGIGCELDKLQHLKYLLKMEKKFAYKQKASQKQMKSKVSSRTKAESNQEKLSSRDDSNTVQDDFDSKAVQDDFDSNKIQDDFDSNEVQDDFDSKEIQDDFDSNVIQDDFDSYKVLEACCQRRRMILALCGAIRDWLKRHRSILEKQRYGRVQVYCRHGNRRGFKLE